MGSNGRNQPLHSTRIDLPVDVRVHVIDTLNATLACTLDLKTQVKQAHWNVKGMDFYQLHELFDEMAAELEDYIDMVAERVTALGGTALGTARIAASQSSLPEYPLTILAGKDHVTALADRFAAYGKLLREGITSTDDLEDADTADLYTEISRAIDKRLWFLEAHLQAAVVVPTASAIANGAKPVEVNGAEATKAPTKAKKTAKRAK